MESNILLSKEITNVKRYKKILKKKGTRANNPLVEALWNKSRNVIFVGGFWRMQYLSTQDLRRFEFQMFVPALMLLRRFIHQKLDLDSDMESLCFTILAASSKLYETHSLFNVWWCYEDCINSDQLRLLIPMFIVWLTWLKKNDVEYKGMNFNGA